MAEQADAKDLKSFDPKGREGSIPSPRTIMEPIKPNERVHHIRGLMGMYYLCNVKITSGLPSFSYGHVKHHPEHIKDFGFCKECKNNYIAITYNEF